MGTDIPKNGSTFEVLDSYGIPCFKGSLIACGVWIDPVLGIAFEDGMNGWKASDDADRVEKQDDGSFIVKNYEGPGGMGGEFVVRPVR